MIRAIALSLALLIGIGVIVPLATDYAEAGAKKHRKYAKKKKKLKKYSRAWWRQYRSFGSGSVATVAASIPWAAVGSSLLVIGCTQGRGG